MGFRSSIERRLGIGSEDEKASGTRKEREWLGQTSINNLTLYSERSPIAVQPYTNWHQFSAPYFPKWVKNKKKMIVKKVILFFLICLVIAK